MVSLITLHMYRIFVKDFESVAALHKKQVKKSENDEFTPFVLHREVNSEQLGYVLLQEQDDRSLRPICYFNRTLIDSECN